jgi:glutamate synthase domain-containing protein 2
MSLFDAFVMHASNALVTVLALLVALAIVAILAMYIADVSQTADAIRRNYPVIGRFRSFFSTLGEFFRQYFFAMDREEMPFNRAERDWVYRSSEGGDNTAAFGSTRNLSPVGTAIFVNAAYPQLDEETQEAPPVTIGPHAREPYTASSIINVSGMSYGALSRPAVRALSRGAKMAGCWLNTGEGGLSPFHLEGGCDVVFQIGTAKYGVRTDDGRLSDEKLREIAAHDQVKMIEIKLSQGAKPGKGGILPAEKVTEEIAKIRGIPAGKPSISPNRHIEVADNTELLDLIGHVREVSGKPTGIKCVIGAYGWIEALCEEINRRGIEHAPDFISIDSGDGGTGAAPMPLMDNVGLTIRQSLPMVVNILTHYGLRDRIKVIAAGKLITPAEVAWAYCAGADFVVSARGFMFALGCIQAMKCNKNTCPTGVTTHQPHLQRGLDPADKAVRVKNFVEKMRYGVGVISHSCGAPHPRALKRHHVHLMQADGSPRPFDQIFPEPAPDDKTPLAGIQGGPAPGSGAQA